MTAAEKQALRKQYADYITAWQQRDYSKVQLLICKAQEARTLADRCVEMLVQHYAIKRAWLIGSLLAPESFHERSDIDLVVEGLPHRDYFPALARIYSMLPSGFELDLLTLETVQPGLRESIMTQGELLYEQS